MKRTMFGASAGELTAENTELETEGKSYERRRNRKMPVFIQQFGEDF